MAETTTKKKKSFFKGGMRKKNRKEKKTDVPNGEESVYSVAFDASTKQSGVPSLGTEKTPLGDPIHVILLLMDPKTRRFELLQLEFDSSVAKVSDIYGQINASATEITLKSQEYNSLTNLKSEQLDDSKLISAYIDSAGIVIAVPSSSGESPEAITKLATPILTNPKVHKMLSNSDLDIADLPEPVEKKAPEPPKPKELPVEEKKEESTPVVEEPTPAPEATTKSSFNVFSLVAVAIVAHLILKVHVHYTSPLTIGNTLAPGRSRGFCGLNSLSPFSSCESAVMTMGDDNVFTVTKGGEVVYELTGKDCEEECVPGLTIDEDGKVKINGSRVKTTMKATIDLQPWPFAEDVDVPKTLF